MVSCALDVGQSWFVSSFAFRQERERAFILDDTKLEMMKQNRMRCRETIKSRVGGRHIQGIKQHLFDIQAELVCGGN